MGGRKVVLAAAPSEASDVRSPSKIAPVLACLVHACVCACDAAALHVSKQAQVGELEKQVLQVREGKLGGWEAGRLGGGEAERHGSIGC